MGIAPPAVLRSDKEKDEWEAMCTVPHTSSWESVNIQTIGLRELIALADGSHGWELGGSCRDKDRLSEWSTQGKERDGAHSVCFVDDWKSESDSLTWWFW
jgi:hypothetical protein